MARDSRFICILLPLIIFSCRKKEIVSNGTVGVPNPPPQRPPSTTVVPCPNRPVINATLVHIGSLSVGRVGLVSGSAGSKILFAGGAVPFAYSPRVDIYDTITRSWSTAELTVTARQGMAVAAIGNKIFFAGGQDADWIDVTSRIDIYDAATNLWSTAELSEPRAYLATATLGNKVFFAGGANWSNQTFFAGSTAVDVYDNSTNTWTKMNLSEGRYELTATIAGNKIYFAGGLNNIHSASTKIDIFDGQTNSWSTSYLHQAKTGHASIFSDNKIYWAGGANTSYANGYNLSNTIEILDLASGLTSFECISPKSFFNAVMKDSLIIFFTGAINLNDPNSGSQFEVCNVNTRQWSTGVLSNKINNATIVSVNNTLYVAGGRGDFNGPYYSNVWRLDL